MREMFMIRKNIIGIALIIGTLALSGFAQQATTFTGTAVIYGSGFNTRTVTRTFTLRVNGRTSPADAARYLRTLESGGQDSLLSEIRTNELGRFSLGSSIGRDLNAVIVDSYEGKTRIRAVFERWIGFGELRYGARSVDYPFGYVEILVDPRTGKGEGTFIPASRIRFKNGKNGGGDTVEIEDFGTFPGRLIGVTMRGRMAM